MRKLILLLLFAGAFAGLSAHQAELSTILLTEQEDGTWQLQLAAALTAFRYEVIEQNGEDSYDSPEAFRRLLLDLLADRLELRFDGRRAEVVNRAVSLGHETKVVLELRPGGTVSELMLTNKSFTNIAKSQSVLMVQRSDGRSGQLVLSKSNGYSASITTKDGRLMVLEGATGVGEVVLYAALGLFVVFTLAIMALLMRNNQAWDPVFKLKSK